MNLPATPDQFVATLKEGNALQQFFGHVFDELGGIDFAVQWAEENPSEFMKAFMSVMQLTHAPTHAGTQNVINVHSALQPGPLDVKGEVIDGD